MKRELLLQSEGRDWKRGATIGRGCGGIVSLAITKKPRTRQSYFPPVMVVKSAEYSRSCELQKERIVLSVLGEYPHVIRCYYDEVSTAENDQEIYNVLLEFGSGGTLADQIKKSNGGLPESQIRCYTRSILQGLNHIHQHGFVHCDIKPENIVLVPNSLHCCLGCDNGADKFVAKITNFQLAKNTEQDKRRKVTPIKEGTPLYMSPECAADDVQESRADIWALGCVVAEMVNGKPVWDSLGDLDVDELLFHVGSGGKLPEIPSEMSEEGKDFLKRCFVRNPMFRWTAEMLLFHPFVAADDEEIEESKADVTGLDTISITTVTSTSCQMTKKSKRASQGTVQRQQGKKSTKGIPNLAIHARG